MHGSPSPWTELSPFIHMGAADESSEHEQRKKRPDKWGLGSWFPIHLSCSSLDGVSALPVLVSAAAGAGLEEIHFQMSEVTLNL